MDIIEKKLINHFKSSPRYTIKWDNYFEIYDEIFKKYENKKITIVEIGIGDGGSLFMWRSFFKENARIIGIELNPSAKKLEEYGFEIFIGDQSDKKFWEDFYSKIGKIDILLDDGGHKNLQQITSVYESINNINDDGMIIIEDTHSSYMSDKGFNNPSKNSFINYCNLLIESIHRRNPMINKNMNIFSKKIHSIQFFDSIVVLNIFKKELTNTKLISNNPEKKIFFIDYRHNNYFIKIIELLNRIFGDINEKSYFYRIIKKITQKNFLISLYENQKIKKYFKIIKRD